MAQTNKNDFDNSATALKIVVATYAEMLITSNKIYDPLRSSAEAVKEDLAHQTNVFKPRAIATWLKQFKPLQQATSDRLVRIELKVTE